MSLSQKIAQLHRDIDNFCFDTVEQVERFRVVFLSTKGAFKQIFEQFRSASAEDKKVFGKQLNALKQKTEEILREQKQRFASSPAVRAQRDLSQPGPYVPIGSRHPIRSVEMRIVSIFERIHFRVVDGPEIEDDFHNFTALNMPEDHPARDMQDTFYVHATQGLLRTHTSNVQVRELKKNVFPLRVICPGKVFRNETISARSHCFFHQIEGLFVDKHVSFADLKQTLLYFVQQLFGPDVRIRLRPSYFPFTEPSAEMDISCLICKGGDGCRLCKYSGWVEILGCGMVNPQVLQNCGVDTDAYRGYAFGMGVERIAMLLYQIDDVRLFSENDLRFLSQFSTL